MTNDNNGFFLDPVLDAAPAEDDGEMIGALTDELRQTLGAINFIPSHVGFAEFEHQDRTAFMVWFYPQDDPYTPRVAVTWPSIDWALKTLTIIRDHVIAVMDTERDGLGPT